jgi:hypothetical protein
VTLSAQDRLDILELIARADNAASDRDPDAYLALFTDDAVLDGEQGEYHGQEGLRRAAVSVWPREPPGTLHLTLNTVIDPADDAGTGAGTGPAPDPATELAAVARSVLVIVEPGAEPRIVHIARITQHVRRSSGTWRITHRNVASSRAPTTGAVPTGAVTTSAPATSNVTTTGEAS